MAGAPTRRLAGDVLEPLRRLGGEQEEVWEGAEATFLVSRKAWQAHRDFSGGVLVHQGPETVVAADATLYDRPGLLRALASAGIEPAGDSPSALIEAAYRAWGTELVRHLNGDYAFALWDRRRRRLFAARDPIGGRPLFVTRIGQGVALSSSCRTLAELRGTAAALNLANLGALVGGLGWSHGSDTAYEGIDVLLPGRTLAWADGRTVEDRFWRAEARADRAVSSMDAAAEELRGLLRVAVTERLGSEGATAWMSGGWDSTAVFAAGQDGLAPSERGRFRPVSISYPEGDPGREDAYIQAAADRWGSAVHWIDSASLELLEGLVERCGETDEPPAHLYERWNRGLARGTRSLGARVAVDGGGGDQLFQVSDIRLADLLARGKWLAFASEAWARRGFGWRHAARLGLLPHLPPGVVAAAERWTGRRIPRHYLERNLTPWVRGDREGREALRARDLASLRSERGGSHAETETQLYLSMPVWGWGAAYMRGALLDEGVEVRSPLLDLRVVEFALGRPVAERADGKETKRLLRAAMRGLLPDSVLQARPHRTGVTVGFSRARMRELYPVLLRRLLGAPLRLAELKLVEPGALRRAIEEYLAGRGDDFLRVNLFHTMKVEFWLRGLDVRGSRQPRAAEPGHLATRPSAA